MKRMQCVLYAVLGLLFVAGCSTVTIVHVPLPVQKAPVTPVPPAAVYVPPAVRKAPATEPVDRVHANVLPVSELEVEKNKDITPQAGIPDTILCVQIGLDRLNFSPGCLDGRMGSQTRSAIEAWQLATGAPVTGVVTDEQAKQLMSKNALTTWMVTEEDRGGLADIPVSWRGKAALPYLGYETMLECIAERFHSSELCIMRLNPGVSWADLPVGAVVNVPDVRYAGRVSAARLEVNLQRKFVRAYDAGDRLVAHFPCSIARLREKRPAGRRVVVNVAENPVYTFDPAQFAEEPEASEIQRKLILQAGPNNPVGVAWIGLDLPGYGLHGTPRPEEIGKTESHGCIRLSNWNARKLIGMVCLGMPVDFTGTDDSQ